MVRAAVDGVVDFSGDFRDKMYVKGIVWRMAELERREWLRLQERLHDRHLAYLGSPHLQPTAAQSVADKEAHALDRIIGSVFGTGHTKTERRAQKAAEFKQAWSRVFGDPDDPVVQARIQATARALLEQGVRRK